MVFEKHRCILHCSQMESDRLGIIKKLWWPVADVTVLIMLLIAVADVRVSTRQAYCYDDVSELPHKKLGVVLGTAKYRVSGGVNNYYQYRLDAAVELFESGKVDFLLVSGDNSLREYDEPTTIKRDLVARGIPANRIFLDYAGFRTLDSMVRCKLVFGENDIIVISQPFHNERALYIAHHHHMKAIGFNAREVGRLYGLKTALREKLARTKTLLDIHVLKTTPKFLGERIHIELPADTVVTPTSDTLRSDTLRLAP